MNTVVEGSQEENKIENTVDLSESFKDLEEEQESFSEKEAKDAQNALLESMMQLTESEDPRDQALLTQLRAKFTEKMEKFDANLKSLPRATRRKFKDYNSFSKQFKRRVGL